MSITVPYNFTPRWYQLELLNALEGEENKPNSGVLKACIVWHRRSGKDVVSWCFLVGRAWQKVGNYYYVFPNKTQARKALWENINSDGFRLLEHLPRECIASINKQEMSIVLTNGSTITVTGYDEDPDSVRGIQAAGVVFSEFAFSDPRTYRIFSAVIGQSKAWVIFNSTPNGRNHFYDMYMNVKDNPKWFCSLRQTWWPDQDGYTGERSKQELLDEQNEQGIEEEEMEREFGCSFSSGLKGSYYADCVEKALTSGRICAYTYDDTKKVDTFWDLGVDDSTAVWFRQKVGNKLIFIDYYEDNSKDIQFYVKMLESKGYNYGTHYLPHDAAHRNIQTAVATSDLFEDMCEASGISSDVIVLDKISRQSGINNVRSRFSRYCFDEIRCAVGLKHVELYHKKFDKRTRTYLSEPAHDSSSHAADALRMEAISEDNATTRSQVANSSITHKVYWDVWE